MICGPIQTALIFDWKYMFFQANKCISWYCHRKKHLRLNGTRTTRTPAFWGYPRRLMITHTIESYSIPSQKNNRSWTEIVTERTRFSKSRSNDLEDKCQGHRSSHATTLLMLVIICTKYGKNLSRTVDATERTRFSKQTPNYLEYIG